MGLKEAWKLYGCTILSDGWKDIQKRSMINILVSSCVGTTFLRVIDVSNEMSITGLFIWQHIRAAILEVGPENVVQVCTDNASNCKSMGDMLEDEFPSIVWTPCASHSLDLMMEDIGKLPWVANVVEKACQVVNWVTRKPKALTLFRKECNWELVKPSKTRFGYIFLVLSR